MNGDTIEERLNSIKLRRWISRISGYVLTFVALAGFVLTTAALLRIEDDRRELTAAIAETTTNLEDAKAQLEQALKTVKVAQNELYLNDVETESLVRDLRGQLEFALGPKVGYGFDGTYDEIFLLRNFEERAGVQNLAHRVVYVGSSDAYEEIPNVLTVECTDESYDDSEVREWLENRLAWRFQLLRLDMVVQFPDRGCGETFYSALLGGRELDGWNPDISIDQFKGSVTED